MNDNDSALSPRTALAGLAVALLLAALVLAIELGTRPKTVALAPVFGKSRLNDSPTQQR